MQDPTETKNSSNNKNELNQSIIDKQKRTVLKVFGYEISAPESTKNPLLILFGLVFLNLILLFLLRTVLLN